MRNFRKVAMMAVMLFAAAMPLRAAETSNTFTVTLTVISTCALAATPMEFGTAAGAISADIEAESTIEVVCSAGTPWDLMLGPGNGSNAPAQRAMSNAADTNEDGDGIPAEAIYNLFVDQARQVVWDDTGGQSTGIGDGSAQAVTVYGKVFPQTIPRGVYTDTIIATLSF